MLNLNKNTRLFFFQYIFQRDYTTDFELDDFLKQNLRKRPCNKKKLRSMYQSFVINEINIKELINDEILKKTNKISIFLVYAFYSEYLNKNTTNPNSRSIVNGIHAVRCF